MSKKTPRPALEKDDYTVTEAAEYLGYRATSAIRVFCETGYLPAKKLSNGFLIKLKDLKAFQRPPRGRPKA